MSFVPLNQQPGACRWCSSAYQATFHGGPCPNVRSIEYHPDGTIKRIEFQPVPTTLLAPSGKAAR